MTIYEAYEWAKYVFEDFRITCCYELEDCWIFICSCTKSGDATFVKPLKILKNGENAELWNHKFMNCFALGDWLDENGKEIPLETLDMK